MMNYIEQDQKNPLYADNIDLFGRGRVPQSGPGSFIHLVGKIHQEHGGLTLPSYHVNFDALITQAALAAGGVYGLSSVIRQDGVPDPERRRVLAALFGLGTTIYFDSKLGLAFRLFPRHDIFDYTQPLIGQTAIELGKARDTQALLNTRSVRKTLGELASRIRGGVEMFNLVADVDRNTGEPFAALGARFNFGNFSLDEIFIARSHGITGASVDQLAPAPGYGYLLGPANSGPSINITYLPLLARNLRHGHSETPTPTATATITLEPTPTATPTDTPEPWQTIFFNPGTTEVNREIINHPSAWSWIGRHGGEVVQLNQDPHGSGRGPVLKEYTTGPLPTTGEDAYRRRAQPNKWFGGPDFAQNPQYVAAPLELGSEGWYGPGLGPIENRWLDIFSIYGRYGDGTDPDGHMAVLNVWPRDDHYELILGLVNPNTWGILAWIRPENGQVFEFGRWISCGVRIEADGRIYAIQDGEVISSGIVHPDFLVKDPVRGEYGPPEVYKFHYGLDVGFNNPPVEGEDFPEGTYCLKANHFLKQAINA